MKYGHFDDATREYVVTNPRTPVKWINYVGDLGFGGFVDHTGGSLICKGDPALNRITRYMAQLPAGDMRGETMYLRVGQAEGFRVFSPYFAPTLDRYDRYECRMGLGYLRIVSEFHGVRFDARIFVPTDAPVLIRDITVTNITKNPLTIDAVPVADFTHPDALKQLTNADWVPQTMTCRAHRESDGKVVLVQYPFMFRDSKVNFFASNQRVSSFETDRRRFLGDNEYRSWADPLSLVAGELSNNSAVRGDTIAALMHHLGEVPPGESRRLITLLGQGQSLETAMPLIRRFRQEQTVDHAFDTLASFWNGILSRLQVETPDRAMNSMLNVHNPRQCYVTKTWSRYLSLYQLGYGARGIGFRDGSQDILGVLDRVPSEARAFMLRLMSVQKADGSAMHQFNPLTMEGARGDATERDDRPGYYSDDHLWMVLAVCWYLKETGDMAFLSETVPYYEKDRDGKPTESGTVLDHLERGIAFTAHDLGRHGLPLLGFADWNDTVNLATGAESSFTACLYGAALRELIELLQTLGHSERINTCQTWFASMRESFEAHAWDGEWYIRYFDADGTPLGSHSTAAGAKIYVNSQSWPVIAGFSTPERGRKALDSVFAKLNTAKGIKLSWPGFNGYDPARGGITTYPPGAKENGGIFLHTNPWVMIAETILGNGDRAFEYYNQINPAGKNDLIDEFEVEPYVYPQNILGDEHPQFGLGRNSWLSGTASWAYTAATKYILGIRPVYEGLLIDPCVPHDWTEFAVTRVFRSATYRIQVRNPRGICKGAVALRVDGKPVAGSVVPVFGDGREHTVDAVIQ